MSKKLKKNKDAFLLIEWLIYVIFLVAILGLMWML